MIISNAIGAVGMATVVSRGKMSTAQRAPHSGAVMLDESLLHEVQRTLAASGITDCAAFVLVELNEGGLRTAVVDSSTGASLVERGDGKLGPRMLDLSMADHLVRSGRVERPASFEWATELIDLMPDIRARLAVTDGAFAMGARHVAMFRVSRRDYYAGLQPHLLAAQSLWQAVALNSAPPVGALVFMPEHEQWPGLFPTLSHLAPIPAVALRDPGPAAEVPAIGARRRRDDESPDAPVPAAPSLDTSVPAAPPLDTSALVEPMAPSRNPSRHPRCRARRRRPRSPSRRFPRRPRARSRRRCRRRSRSYPRRPDTAVMRYNRAMTASCRGAACRPGPFSRTRPRTRSSARPANRTSTVPAISASGHRPPCRKIVT